MRRRRIGKEDGNPEMEKWIDMPLVYMFTLTHASGESKVRCATSDGLGLYIGHSGTVSCYCISFDSGKP